MEYKLLSITNYLSLVIIFLACSNEKPSTPASRGLPFEMVVIAPEQAYEGELSDSIDAVFRASTPVLPQHEPMFRLNVIWADANLTPFRTYRLRFIAKVNPRASKASIGVARNVVARPQLEVKAEAPSVHELAQFIGRERERLQDLFVDFELDNMAAVLRRKHSTATRKAFHSLTGHTICMPAGLKASKQAKDFLWTGTNLNDRDQNFVSYFYTWDGQPLTASQFVEKRDSALKANIPGSRPDQWMQTAFIAPSGATSAPRGGAFTSPELQSETQVPPQKNLEGAPLILSRMRTINNVQVHEVHGLWEMHNGALGGAFVSIERIDSAARRVLVTEGFIYSPHSPKRPILRELEAALRTFK
ncbi:MAG: DUF4837 family protein [Bacteroidaceae bacterium]|nr:DUF4837 family protein [Bacteroidaceae bacterium]